jgi:energy-coupling factor transport system substrate-specific component
MDNPIFALGDIVALLIVILGAALLLLELSGRTLAFSRPYVRPNGFRWSAAAVATVGVGAAVFVVGLATLGSLIVIIPGFVSLNPARGLETVFGLLFGLPGVAAGMVGSPIGDILTGKLTLGSIAGMVTTGLTSYFFYRLFRGNPGLRNFGRTSVWGRFVFGIVIMAVVIKGIGIAGFLAAIGMLPGHVAWVAAFPSIILNEGISNAIVGAVLTKILYPFVDRIGLSPEPDTHDQPAAGLRPARAHE